MCPSGFQLTFDQTEIVMADERTQAQLQGASPKKVVVVPGRVINFVI
jgi:leucyl-tRNA synthetase